MLFLLHVRKQFQAAFEQCNTREQLAYYLQFVNVMIPERYEEEQTKKKQNNQTEDRLEIPKKSSSSSEKSNQYQQLKFKVQVKGNFTWQNSYLMVLNPSRNRLQLKNLEKNNQILIDLRNYILRQSKHIKKHSYVLCSIVPINPSRLRFAIVTEDKERSQRPSSIVETIKNSFLKSLQLNVELWKKSTKIPIENLSNFIGKQNRKLSYMDGIQNNKQSQIMMDMDIIESKIKQGSIMKRRNKQSAGKEPKRMDKEIIEEDNKQKFMLKINAVDNNQGFKPFHSQDSKFRNNRVSLEEDQQLKNKRDIRFELEDNFTPKESVLSPFNEQIKSYKNNHENYAQHGQDTKSESGMKKKQNFFKQNKRYNTKSEVKIEKKSFDPTISKQISNIKKGKQDEGNQQSGKKLLNKEIDDQIIMEQEDQFGNCSQISNAQDGNSSFYTVKEQQMVI